MGVNVNMENGNLLYFVLSSASHACGEQVTSPPEEAELEVRLLHSLPSGLQHSAVTVMCFYATTCEQLIYRL